MRKCCATPPLLIIVSRVCRMRPYVKSSLDFLMRVLHSTLKPSRMPAEPPTKRVEIDRLWPHSARGSKEVAFMIREPLTP